MRSLSRLAPLLVLLLSTSALAQNLHVGLHAAVGLASMHTPASADVRFDKQLSNPIYSLQLGGAMRYEHRWGRVAIGPELDMQLVRLGGRELLKAEGESVTVETGNALSLWYLQTPLLMNIAVSVPRMEIFAALGPQLGLCFAGTRTRKITVTDAARGQKPMMKEGEASVVFGDASDEVRRQNLSLATRLGVRLFRRYSIYGYYDFGLAPMANFQSSTPWAFTHVYGIALTYYIF